MSIEQISLPFTLPDSAPILSSHTHPQSCTYQEPLLGQPMEPPSLETPPPSPNSINVTDGNAFYISPCITTEVLPILDLETPAVVHASHDKAILTPAWITTVAGTIGGSLGVIVGHPFDTVKVRLQAQSTNPGQGYKGGWDCFKTMLGKEKVRGLYRGMLSPLLGVTTINALLFGVYGTFLNTLTTSHDPSLTHIFIAGSCSGFVNSFIASPMELVKIKLQNQSRVSTPTGATTGGIFYKGPWHYLHHTLRTQSPLSLTRGLTATIARETPSYGAYFASYEGMLRWLTRHASSRGREVGNGELVVAGGMAGVAAWTVTYPFDVMKTRIQAFEPTSTTSTPPRLIPGMHQIIRTEGISTLYRGLVATVVRAFPTNAAVFLGYAWTMKLLQGS